MASVFEAFEAKAWPYRAEATLVVRSLHGGVPNNPKVAEGWIRKAIAGSGQQASDDLIRQQVAEVMVERGISMEEATDAVAKSTTVNGFKKDEQGLYIEGRQIKSCIKESVNIARAAGKIPDKWGVGPGPKKGAKNYWAEHVHVNADRIYLGAQEPDGIDQRFVHSKYGASISNEEYVEEAKLRFPVVWDASDITEHHWAMVWLTAEKQGIGASRSQSYGRFEVTEWEVVV